MAGRGFWFGALTGTILGSLCCTPRTDQGRSPNSMTASIPTPGLFMPPTPPSIDRHLGPGGLKEGGRACPRN